ncbi:phosphate ABC transporter substrate-binding protein [Aestuariibacter sp. AA17]|uniref:Phosphate ABC transporter substrate-binding protein n=1 Tax=Fluctibacter corallii TaxID=2984329 RepID=A0ABT3AC23_9ALTE|nr:phosphate ABC transporter substrate-binding protein [Aestuariibacter sp. AA17]MCV2886203.1 phosphate ABC transporter substrate-binding protein [Aestuariibacter sp. AA17]
MKKLLALCLASTFSLNAMAVTVIVHPSNSEQLDQASISRIFLGKAKSFPSGSSAVPINLEESSATTEEFNSKVLNKSSSQLKAYWSKLVFTGKGTPPKTVSSDAEMINLIANNPNMIGFISGEGDGSVKAVGTF